MKTIVVGYDGSEHGRRALERAGQLAADGASVRVVSAIRISRLVRDPARGTSPLDPAEVEERKRNLEEARAFLGEKGIETFTVEGHGDPADVIVDEARESSADLIVVGTHGRNFAERAVLGSVSTKVVHNANCDVLVVR